MKYFINRLTAPKPEWYGAIIYAKGVEPFGVIAERSELRYIKDEMMIIISVKNVTDPFDPPKQGIRTGPNPQDILPPTYGSICDSEVHFHEEEIVRIEFLTNRRENKPMSKVTEPASPILDSNGSTDEEEKKREELITKDREMHGLKSV